ncbi:MAG: Cas10/Cmr2 second palm domain-containing protein [Pseudonocardiaceae bacterium]
MTVYLDIGAKRIQAYLARTSRLRGRRGASALLEYEMLRDWTKGAWSGHAQINEEGKQTDGVLSLSFTNPDVDDRTVDDVVTETSTLLQRLAPGAEWDVLVRQADSYRQAQHDDAVAQRAGQDLLPNGGLRYRPLPVAPNEVPVVRSCETCGLDSAVLAVRTEYLEPDEADGDKKVSLCADCSRRFLEGGHRTDARNWDEARRRWQQKIAPGGLDAERKLRVGVEQLKGLSASTLRVARDFSDLAALGSGDANHLCTVFADGNRFGDLFKALKDSKVSLRNLSGDLTKAVRGALITATAAVTREKDTCLPVVPHLVGGDDLLASVTAERAWDFVVAFLDDYHQRTNVLATDYQERAGVLVPPPTASAGLVFAHATYPFADCLDLAETALRRAKSRHKALEPAVCWVDVTEDGPELPLSRAAPSLAELAKHRTNIDNLGDIPPSGRARLAEAAQYDDTEVAAQAYRLGHMDLIRPFLQPKAPMPLVDALILGRWWQCRQTG